MRLRDVGALLKDAAVRWWGGRSFELGAALAYYAVFSLAPILLLAVTVAGLLFGEAAARGQLTKELPNTVSPTVAQAIEGLLAQAGPNDGGLLATVIGLVVLLFAAAAFFTQLQQALNAIWEVKPRPGRGILDVIKERLLSFLMVLSIGLLLLALMVLHSVLAALDRLVPAALPGGVLLWQGGESLTALAFVTLLLGLTFKVLPDVQLTLGDVWPGALATALLFLLGNWLIGFYIQVSGTESTYGAAGSVVVVLLWVYYSSQTLLFGAELTRAYAERTGRPKEPMANAQRTTAG
jgi:membrane protein